MQTRALEIGGVRVRIHIYQPQGRGVTFDGGLLCENEDTYITTTGEGGHL